MLRARVLQEPKLQDPAGVQPPLGGINPVFDHDGSSHFGRPPTDRPYTFPGKKGELRLRFSDLIRSPTSDTKGRLQSSNAATPNRWLDLPQGSRLPRSSSGGDLQSSSFSFGANVVNIDRISPSTSSCETAETPGIYSSTE
eukprot:1191178-Prorocentrum_minimum.AAC.1